MTLNLNPNPQLKKDNRMLAVGLAFAAAACLLVAAFTKNWLANGEHRKFGPLGYTICEREFAYRDEDAKLTCESGSNSKFVEFAKKQNEAMAYMRQDFSSDTRDEAIMRTRLALSSKDPTAEWKASSAFPITGFITMGLSILAALALIWSAVIALQKKRPELKISPTTIALLSIFTAMITGCIFVATKPGPLGFVGVSWSFWAFGAGTVVGIATAQMIAKLIRPIDPDLVGLPTDPYA